MTDRDIRWRGRAILHVDMDAFFASVEQLDHPEWRGKPVIVGGSPDGRGVVSAASYEARRFGVRSAMPAAQAARLCPDAIWARGSFGRYRELSAALMAILKRLSPLVEQVSVDEAFADVTPGTAKYTDPASIARRIQEDVDAMGLSCSIGLATSKTVAKIASDREKPHGLVVVAPGGEAAFLAPLPVAVLPGVGARTQAQLRDAGIRTLGELAALDVVTASQLLGSGGPDLVARARGLDDAPVRGRREAKSVSHEHTFRTDVRESERVEREVRELACRVAARLRRTGVAGKTVTLKLRYADFTTKTSSRTVGSPTDLDSEIASVAIELLRAAWTPGAGLRLIGVGVSGFAAPSVQLELLGSAEEARRPRAKALAESVDAVRERFGEDAISHGVRVEDEESEEEG